MVSLIHGIYTRAYNVAKGRDVQSRISLSYQDARKEAKKLLNTLGTVSIAAGAFFTLSAVMQKISPNHSFLGTGVLTAGCVALSKKRVSPLVTQASLITTGLFIMRAGVSDLVISPLIQSVKAAWIAQPQVLDLVVSCVSGVAFGYLRGIGGLVSLGIGIWVMDSASKEGPKSRHPLDRGVNYLSKKCASGLVALFGYKKYSPPAQGQPLRSIPK